MKKLLALLLIGGLIVVTAGCPTSPTTPGGKPKDTKPGETPKTTKSNGAAKPEPMLKVMADDVTVKKDGSAMAKVKVERKDFAMDEEVKVTFDPPADIKVEGITIAKEKKEGEAKVMAGKDAKSGEVKIEASSGGKKAMGKFNVKVEE